MKQVSGKELCRLLEQHGWELKRINGSHHTYGMQGRSERISVPVHANQPLKIGLLKALLKIAGLTESDLQSFVFILTRIPPLTYKSCTFTVDLLSKLQPYNS